MLTTSPDGQRDFQQELLALANDPAIRRLARWRARDPEIAEDAIQGAYYAVARVKDPAAIIDLRAYFCTVLTREVYRLLGQLGALLVDDFASVADARPDRSHGNASAPRPVDETVSSNILVYGCLKIFAAQRQDLAATVPSRSLDPGRYRDVIITVAEQVLYDSLTDHTSDADCNAALRAAYPEWFAEPGYPENTQHQRFRRARVDVRDVLRIIINRDDLRA